MRGCVWAVVLAWLGACGDPVSTGGGWSAADGVAYTLPDELRDRLPDRSADPVTEDETGSGCGAVLVVDTVLVADIGPCVGDGLVFAADGVTLDCGGYAIVGTGRPGTVGVELRGTVGGTVRGCGVAGFGAAFSLHGATGAHIEANTIDGGGEGVVLTGGDDNTVVANVVRDVEGAGVRVVGPPYDAPLGDAVGNRVLDNSVTASGYGVVLDHVEGQLVEGNTLTGNRGIGLHLLHASRNVLRGNVADANGVDGLCVFAFSMANHVEGNAACGNGSFDAEQRGSEGTVYADNTFCVTYGI